MEHKHIVNTKGAASLYAHLACNGWAARGAPLSAHVARRGTRTGHRAAMCVGEGLVYDAEGWRGRGMLGWGRVLGCRGWGVGWRGAVKGHGRW